MIQANIILLDYPHILCQIVGTEKASQSVLQFREKELLLLCETLIVPPQYQLALKFQGLIHTEMTVRFSSTR